jgi:hypothetical protein
LCLVFIAFLCQKVRSGDISKLSSLPPHTWPEWFQFLCRWLDCSIRSMDGEVKNMSCEFIENQAIQCTAPRQIVSRLPVVNEESFYQEIIFYVNIWNTKLFISVVPVSSRGLMRNVQCGNQ